MDKQEKILERIQNSVTVIPILLMVDCHKDGKRYILSYCRSCRFNNGMNMDSIYCKYKKEEEAKSNQPAFCDSFHWGCDMCFGVGECEKTTDDRNKKCACCEETKIKACDGSEENLTRILEIQTHQKKPKE